MTALAGGPRRVVIADRDAASRAAVRAALEECGFAVCAEVADGPSAVEAAIRERPDVCLLDMQMPGNGVDAAAAIAACLPGTAMVMLTVAAAADDLSAAIEAGAAGHLFKDVDPARLPFALETLLAARTAGEPGERGRRGAPPAGRAGAELTTRERQILDLLRGGASTAAVARRLGIGQVTVQRHVSEALRKLRVPDRKAAFALLDGLRPDPPARPRQRG